MTKYYSTVDYEENDPNDMVVDYIASMTDDYFVDLYNHLFPNGKYGVKYIGYFDWSNSELIDYGNISNEKGGGSWI